MHTPTDDTALAVRQTIADTLRRTLDEVAHDATLDGAGLGLDSLAVIQLQVALEERFDVALPDLLDGDPARPRAVRDVVALVASLTAGRAA